MIDVRDEFAPTPEQAAKAEYVKAPVFDRDPLTGRVSLKGKAYQRRARFETIQGLTVDQLRALRFYRAEFDKSELSEIKSGLDIEGKGGGGSGAEAAIARIDAIVAARFLIGLIEAGIPTVQLPILRAVALDDQDFKTIAIAIYGGRDVQRIDTSRRKPTLTTSLEPRSGRHRENVREEFLLAARNLVGAVSPFMSNERQPSTDAARRRADVESETMAAVVSEVGLPSVDPAFLDENGRMLPFHQVRVIILERFAASADEQRQGLE
ncbi:hypothetical protein U1839_06160 [Sphingomonas sp. RT2P30]|uniref:hypothetical protein n=1 Tax=Parasphingomonas halimpatiens TaxID=3096162 RepID=UPI002FC5CBC9